MTVPAKRRWFRFSLRTIFVLVTLLAAAFGYAGHEIRLAHLRKTLLAELSQFPNWCTEPRFSFRLQALHDAHPRDQELAKQQYAGIQVSATRRFLGDYAFLELFLPTALDQQLLERVEAAFPEAELHYWDQFETYQFRGSLTAQAIYRRPNIGTIFKTGLIE